MGNPPHQPHEVVLRHGCGRWSTPSRTDSLVLTPAGRRRTVRRSPASTREMEISVARHRWEHLPDDVRDAISAQAGPITSVQHVEAGSVADFTATLSAGAGVFFCKGALLDTKGAGFLRNEIRLNPHLPADLVPRLRWHLQAGDWMMAGFAYAPGRPADLRPGSADLPLIADAVTRMAAALTPCPPVPIQPATARWGRLLDPALVDGDTLLHTDTTPQQLPHRR